MVGSPVKVGPFTGGMNTYSEPTQIGDTEAAEIYNFDIDLDGSLVSRPPLNSIAGASGSAYHFLWLYTDSTGVIYYIYQAGPDIFAWNSSTAAWTTVKAGINSNAAVQYLNKLWIVATAGSPIGGGSWDPVGGFVAVAAMPRGVSAAIYKERLYIAAGKGSANSSRILFSDPSDFTVYIGTNTLDIVSGDGQDIIYLYVFAGQIVIFKSNSTYTFGYDNAPNKGITSKQSATIGIASSSSMIEYESALYVMYGDSLYRVINWMWDQVNVKIPFSYYSFSVKASIENFSVSIIGNRLVCRFYDNFYVYGLKTKVWSIWRFNLSGFTPSKFIRSPNLDTVTGQEIYIADSYSSVGNTYRMFDSPIGVLLPETFKCQLTTKTYDYNSPYTFKRMFHWGVDVLGKTQINFRVYPTVFNTSTRWSQLNGVKWSTLKTWRRPIDTSVDVTASATMTNPSGIRTYIKLLKSLRFRQISFTLDSTVDGTAATGPFRIFSITAFSSNKELVSKKVS